MKTEDGCTWVAEWLVPPAQYPPCAQTPWNDLFLEVERIPNETLEGIETVGEHGCIKIVSGKPDPRSYWTHQAKKTVKRPSRGGHLALGGDITLLTCHLTSQCTHQRPTYHSHLSWGLQLSLFLLLTLPSWMPSARLDLPSVLSFIPLDLVLPFASAAGELSSNEEGVPGKLMVMTKTITEGA